METSLLSNRVRSTIIKDIEYQIYVLPAGEGFVMANKLLKVVAPALAAIATSGGEMKDLDLSKVATELVANMDKLDTTAIVARLLKDMSANGQSVVFDTYFMCNYGVLLDLIIFTLKENFSSFFESSVSLSNLA